MVTPLAVRTGRALVTEMVHTLGEPLHEFPAAGMANWMVQVVAPPQFAFACVIAARSEPVPESAVVVTVIALAAIADREETGISASTMPKASTSRDNPL